MLIGAMIILNEESYIVRCLDSFYDSVDSIIILDGGSTDKTLDLIRSYDLVQQYKFPFDELQYGKRRDLKIHIHENKWDRNNPAMFRDQRNLLLDLIRREYKSIDNELWVLMLDADEYLSDGLVSFIKNKRYIDLHNNFEAEIIAFKRRWWVYKESVNEPEVSFDEVSGGTYPKGTIDYQPRLFLLQDKHSFIDPIHEIIKPLDKVFKVEDEDIYLIHSKTFDKYSKQGKYYCDIQRRL